MIHDFMKTIISAIKSCTSYAIKSSTADWNQNDEHTNNYIKNRPFYERNGIIHKIDPKFLPSNIGMQADWDEIDETSKSFILNKPDFYAKMDNNNPAGSGSFSLNRAANSEIGDQSFAIGGNTIASGDNSVATGLNTIATKSNQHAIGKYNIFENKYIEKKDEYMAGSNNIVYNRTYMLASKYEFSPLTGIFTLIEPFSATLDKNNFTGYYTCGYHGDTQGEVMFEIGSGITYNTRNTWKYSAIELTSENKDLLIAGNGNSDSERSNAHTLDWEGNAWFAGDVYVGSTSGTNKDEGSKKLATEEYVINIQQMQNNIKTINLDNYGIGSLILGLFANKGGNIDINLPEEFFNEISTEQTLKLRMNYEQYNLIIDPCVRVMLQDKTHQLSFNFLILDENHLSYDVKVSIIYLGNLTEENARITVKVSE